MGKSRQYYVTSNRPDPFSSKNLPRRGPRQGRRTPTLSDSVENRVGKKKGSLQPYTTITLR